MADVKPEFFYEVIQYLRSSGLEGLLGLQALGTEGHDKFVLGREAGTVMLKESEVNYGRIYRVTEWSFEEKDGTMSCKGNDVHAATVKGTHQVFQGSKPLREIRELRMAPKDAETW